MVLLGNISKCKLLEGHPLSVLFTPTANNNAWHKAITQYLLTLRLRVKDDYEVNKENTDL